MIARASARAKLTHRYQTGCYYFGVVDCWNKYIPRERVNRVAGASAGSLIAAYYLLDLPLDKCFGRILEFLEEIRSRPLGVFDRSFQIVDELPKLLDGLFPDDAHKKVSGRLFVCMTRLKDMKKIIVSEFESKKDLIDALNCSSFIPVWSGNHVATYKGVKHIDGGFSDNLPVFDEHTIRICAFSGHTDISPYDRAKLETLSWKVFNTPVYVNLGNIKRMGRALWPPQPSFVVDLLQQGFHNAKQFILDNDLIQCDACYGKLDWRRDVRPLPALSPIATPALSRANSRLDLARASSTLLLSSSAMQQQQQQASNHLAGAKSSCDVNEAFQRQLCERLDAVAADENNNAACDNIIAHINAPKIVVQNDEAASSSSISASSSSSSSAKSSQSASLRRRSQTCDDLSDTKRVMGGVATHEPRRKLSRPTGPQTTTSEKFMARRGTLQYEPLEINTLLGVAQDRFTLAPSPLPSCPPSPNLNRHCSECLRLRQEARVDRLEEDILREVEKVVKPAQEQNDAPNNDAQAHSPKQSAKRTLRRKLASPIKWVNKQLRTKPSHSYTFVSPDDVDARQSLNFANRRASQVVS